MKRAVYVLTLLLIGFFSARGIQVQAAEVKEIFFWDKDSGTLKADLTHDGKADKISFRQKKDQDNMYVDKFIIKVNGKTVAAVRKSGGLYFGVKYIRLTKKREFVQIYSVAENDYHSTNGIYAYNNNTKKLEKVVNLLKVRARSADIGTVKKNQLSVFYNDQYMEVGSLTWKYIYSVTDKKITLTSPVTSTVKSNLGASDYLKDGYEKYFKKNQYKAAKKIPLYTDVSCTKEAFVAEKNSVLKLTRLSIKSGTPFLMFEMGGKKGWLKIIDHDIYDYSKDDPSTTGLFYGIYGRLAG